MPSLATLAEEAGDQRDQRRQQDGDDRGPERIDEAALKEGGEEAQRKQDGHDQCLAAHVSIPGEG